MHELRVRFSSSMGAPRAIESERSGAARRSSADPGVGPGRVDPGQREWSDPDEPLNILVLADRCWRHPQAGGSGANLYAQVRRWAQAGYRITVIAGDYPGAERLEHVFPNLTVHRMGAPPCSRAAYGP